MVERQYEILKKERTKIQEEAKNKMEENVSENLANSNPSVPIQENGQQRSEVIV